MFIKIINWEKYNPRKDIKSTSWFRLQNDFWTDPMLTKLKPDQKLVWIVLLSLASRARNSNFVLDLKWTAHSLDIKLDSFSKAIKHFEECGKIEVLESKPDEPRDADVTCTLRARTATNERTDGRTNKQTKRDRVMSWDDSDPMAKVFANLKATEQYWLVFDAVKDRATIAGHMAEYGLTIRDMEKITYALRCYCDGLTKTITSPRGVLATFVRNFVAREKKPTAQGAPYKILTQEDLDAM